MEPIPLDPEDPSNGRVAAILEAYCLAQEEGRAVDLKDLCQGDSDLEGRVRDLLAREPHALGVRFHSLAPPSEAPRLEDYSLQQVLGEGGMGTVYRAYQKSLRREVALKILRRGWHGNEHGSVRMRREAELMASLRHPGIVPVHAVGSEDGVEYIAMRLLQGPSLAQVEKPVPARKAAQWGREIATALEAAHLAGIVHRDVKPSNVLLDDGKAVVVDFGLARSTTDATLTREGAVAGTLQYLAPEQLQDGSPTLNPQADVYGLGATLYELLAGHPPFVAEQTQALIHRILLVEPLSLRRLGVDPDLAAIVEQALDKERDRRFASAQSLADDLGRFLAGEGVQARSASPLYRLLRRARRNMPVYVGGTAAAIALCILAFFGARTELRRRAGLDHALEGAARAYGNGALEEAQRFLGQARSGGTQDDRIEELQGQIDLLLSRRDLIDLLLLRDGLVAREEMDAALVALANASGSGAPPPAQATSLALAHFLMGDDSTARLCLQANSGGSRSMSAVEQLLDGNLRRASLPQAAGEEAVLEHLLTTLALRLAGASLEEQREELELAGRVDGDDPRVRLLLADTQSEGGFYARARQTLRGVSGTPKLVRLRLWREIGALLELGDLTGAGQLLERIRFEDRNASEHHYGLVHVQLTQGYRAGIAYLDRLFATGRPSPRAYLDRAMMVGLQAREPDLDRSLELLAQAMDQGPGRHDVQWIRATQLLVQSIQTTNYYEYEGFVVDPAAVEELIGQGRKHLQSVTMADPRARMHAALAILHDWRLPAGEARLTAVRHLEEATRLTPSQFEYRVRLMALLAAEIERKDLDTSLSSYKRAAAESVLGHMDKLDAQVERGDLRSGRVDAYVLRSAALASDHLHLPRAILRHVPRYLAVADVYEPRGEDGEQLRNLLDSAIGVLLEQPRAIGGAAVSRLAESFGPLVEAGVLDSQEIRSLVARLAAATSDAANPLILSLELLLEE